MLRPEQFDSKKVGENRALEQIKKGVEDPEEEKVMEDFN